MQKMLRNRWILLAVWFVVTVLFIVTQPDIKQILNEKGEVTINNDAPSRIAAQMLNNMDISKGDTAILVFTDKNKLSNDKMKDIQQGIDKLNQIKGKLQITNIIDPFGTPDVKDQLISKDNTTLLVQLYYEKGTRDNETIISEFEDATKGINVEHYITGELAISNDYIKSVGKGVDKSGMITIAFILVILIIMFRSIVTPLVSLFAVGVSYLCSMGIIGLLINWFNFPITSFTQMFIILVLFGIGTDYHILLFNRFKEELGNGMSLDDAIITTFKTAGKTVIYSGLTVFIGFASLSFVKFPVYRSANAVAIGIAVLLIEIMTLTPLLMRVIAGKLFWPSKHTSGHKESKLWELSSSAAVKHPVIALFVIALILSPIIIFSSHQLSFDSLKDLSSDNPSVKGFNIVTDKFGAGKAMPTTIVIKNKNAMDNNEALAVLDNLTDKIKGLNGVAQVMGPTRPKGDMIAELYTNTQTKTVVNGLSQANDGVNKIKSGLDTIKINLASQDFSKVKDLSNGTGQLQTGIEAVTSGLETVNSGIRQGANGADKLNAGIVQLKNGVASIHSGVQLISEKLTTIYNGYKTIGEGYKQIPQYVDTLKQVLGAMQASIAKINAKLPNDSDVTALKTMVDKLSSELDKMSSGIIAANLNYDKLTTGLSQVNDGVKAIIVNTGENSQLLMGINELEKGSAALASGLKQGSDGQDKIIASMAQLSSGAQKVKAGQDTLYTSLSQLGSGMNQLKDGINSGSKGLGDISNGISQSCDFLTQITDNTKTFYIPKEAFQKTDVNKMLDAYMSKDRKTLKLTVILDSEPYSDSAIKMIDKLDSLVSNNLKGTSLDGAEYGISGPTAHSKDMSDVATHDITFTQIIVLVAIFILLIIVIKSFWIPVYIIASLAAAYYTALSATAFISKLFFSSAKLGLSWNVPFFAFIAITSLGVDYSIFLMRRFKEYPELSARDAIIQASRNIGGVVISAATILAGTFATLYPSNLIVLIELAICVVIGLFLLAFVFLPLVIPAMMSISEKAEGNMKKHSLKSESIQG